MKKIYIKLPMYIPKFVIDIYINYLMHKKILTKCNSCWQIVRNGNFCEKCGHKLII